MFASLYTKLIAAVVTVTTVLGAWLYVQSLRSSVTKLTTENVVLSSKLSEQNAAIETLKHDADARVQASAALVAAAKEETRKAAGRSTIIYKSKPSVPGDDCKSALNLLNMGSPE
jgi:hypothetical protein